MTTETPVVATSKITVALATDLDLDPTGGEYVTVCQTHGTIANSPTKALAEAAVGEDFCEYCHDESRGVSDMTTEFAEEV